MGMFQRGDTIQASGRKREKFPLPELGKDKYILVRAMTAQEVRERNAIETSIRQKIESDYADESKESIEKRIAENPEMQGSAIIAMCAVNEDGSPVFTDGADVDANLPIEFGSMLGMVRKIMELSGLANIRDRTKN